MRSRIATLFVAPLAFLALAASPAGATPAVFRIPLTAAQVPTVGDPNGSGQATVVVDDVANRVCVGVVVHGFVATGAHVHQAVAGRVGPHAADLDTPRGTAVTSASVTCAPVSNAVARDILANPAGYYVNVHSAAYPLGAVRGQLA